MTFSPCASVPVLSCVASAAWFISTVRCFLSPPPSYRALLHCAYPQCCFSFLPALEQHPRKSSTKPKREGLRRGTPLPLNLPLLLFLLNLACTWCLRLKPYSVPLIKFPHLFAHFLMPSNIQMLYWWFEVVPQPENICLRRCFSFVL